MSTAPAASDQWFFEIGDGQVYGPYTLEKLQKWAAAGNLMPTHRVRRADSSEWIIAAYIPGLELTTAAPAGQVVAEREDPEAHSKLASLARTLGLKGKGDAKNAGADLPDVIEFCDQLLETALERGASDLHIDPEESFSLVQLRVDGQLEPLRKLPIAIHGAAPATQPNQNGFIVTCSVPDGVADSWSQPNRIIATFAPERRRFPRPTASGSRCAC